MHTHIKLTATLNRQTTKETERQRDSRKKKQVISSSPLYLHPLSLHTHSQSHSHPSIASYPSLSLSPQSIFITPTTTNSNNYYYYHHIDNPTMEALTIDSFLPYLEPFNNHELLTPLECSKLSLIIVELLVDHYVDFPLLKFLSRFLTQQSYDELVEERNIEHECGYIMCNQSPKSLVRRLSMNSNGFTQASSLNDPGASTKYQIYNRKPSMILPNTYLSQYCCKDHYQASIFYRNQLSNEAIFSRKDIMTTPPFPMNKNNWYENSITCLEEVIAKHKELKQHGKSISEVIAMMNGLSVSDLENSELNEETNRLIKLIEDFEIVEKDEPNFHGDYAEPEGNSNTSNELPEEDDEEYEEHLRGITNNVEGYVTSNKSFGGYVV